MQCDNAICSLDCATECKRHQLLNALCAWLYCRGAVVYETMTNTVSFCEDEVKIFETGAFGGVLGASWAV